MLTLLMLSKSFQCCPAGILAEPKLIVGGKRRRANALHPNRSPSFNGWRNDAATGGAPCPEAKPPKLNIDLT
ncbi:hypothetical protein [Pseudaminobacter salicylatoxidans]|uniref:hypothetical protein n=1 Tax=Pseudaminobacter salicylatoxidans TaxID=93369 RepID=UPI0014731C70|nr:hypothetical protein [Pseudaminobacter salicylatoxidans]